MTKLRNWLQHKTNPLHIFCRLLDIGMTQGAASTLAYAYQRAVYQHLPWGM